MANASPVAATTPADLAASESQQKTVAVKDRACEWCNQLFTSSSLGRHYDSFIKKAKEPDGVHDVDEIRKLRENITRRTARAKLLKAELKRKQSGAGADSPAIGPSPTSSEEPTVASTTRKRINERWRAVNPNRRSLAITTPYSRRSQRKTGLEDRRRAAEEEDTPEARELALKELFKRIQQAKYDPNIDCIIRGPSRTNRSTVVPKQQALASSTSIPLNTIFRASACRFCRLPLPSSRPPHSRHQTLVPLVLQASSNMKPLSASWRSESTRTGNNPRLTKLFSPRWTRSPPQIVMLLFPPHLSSTQILPNSERILRRLTNIGVLYQSNRDRRSGSWESYSHMYAQSNSDMKQRPNWRRCVKIWTI